MRNFKSITIKSIVALTMLGMIITVPTDTIETKVQEFILNGQYYSEASTYGRIYGAIVYNRDKYTIDGVTVVENGQIVNWDYIKSIADENEVTGIQTLEAQYSAVNAAARKNSTTNVTEEVSSSTPTQTEKKEDTNTQDLTKENTKKENKSREEKTITTPSPEEIESAWMELNRVESTCKEAGYLEYTNSLTGETKKEELPLKEHDYIKKNKTEATCTEDGKIIYECSVCGDTKEEVISATGHAVERITTDAGLFTEGNIIEKCSICGEVISETIIPQKCPIPIAGVIFILIGLVIVGYIVVRKK